MGDRSGSVNDGRTEYTFNNINLRTCLGDMYDKYDLFNLKLDRITMSNVGVEADIEGGDGFTYLFGTDYEDRTVSIEMSGFNLINNSYDSKYSNNTNSTTIATYVFAYQNAITNYNNDAIVTIGKSSEFCTVTFKYLTVHAGLPPDVGLGAHFPNMIYHFSLFGIPKDSIKLPKMSESNY